MTRTTLRDIVYKSLISMSTEKGINASGRDEVYGCIFGRDSAITILKVLKVCAENKSNRSVDTQNLIHICKRALLTLMSLQGKDFNLESGEEPGKFIHEYRTERFEHLLKLTPAWYVYPDNTLRNYDSLDSTPLALIALYRFYQLTHDSEFIKSALPVVEKGLSWIMTLADRDGDGLVEYEFNEKRTFGGLRVQSWTDSIESLQQEDGSFPLYPIAPVEVQGYTWLALKLWEDFYRDEPVSQNHTYAKTLKKRADIMKKSFNTAFLFKDEHLIYPAQALDGNKKQIRTITGNPLLLLWATHRHGSIRECILDAQYMDDLVARAFRPDMFDEDAGIRTMSEHSHTFDPSQNSYHNGSFWPKLNGMAHEGLMKWGYHEEARKLRVATLSPIKYFKSPIELYIKTHDGKFVEYKNAYGQVSCREQAWSAASVLDLLTL